MFRPVCSHVPALAFSVASLQVLPVFQLLTGGVSPALEQNTNQTLPIAKRVFLNQMLLPERPPPWLVALLSFSVFLPRS